MTRPYPVRLAFFLGLILVLAGCIPKIYVIDRQTVLEDEAAGEWPEFESRLLGPGQARTPTPSARTRESERKARISRVLNGDVVETR